MSKKYAFTARPSVPLHNTIRLRSTFERPQRSPLLLLTFFYIVTLRLVRRSNPCFSRRNSSPLGACTFLYSFRPRFGRRSWLFSRRVDTVFDCCLWRTSSFCLFRIGCVSVTVVYLLPCSFSFAQPSRTVSNVFRVSRKSAANFSAHRFDFPSSPSVRVWAATFKRVKSTKTNPSIVYKTSKRLDARYPFSFKNTNEPNDSSVP